MGTIGVGLIYLGSGIMTVANIWMVVKAFKDSVMWGLLVWLVGCPCYFIFLAKNWEDAKKPFFLSLAGLGVVCLGAATVVGSSDLIQPDLVSTRKLVSDEGSTFTVSVPTTWTIEERASGRLVIGNIKRHTHMVALAHGGMDYDYLASDLYLQDRGREPSESDMIPVSAYDDRDGTQYSYSKPEGGMVIVVCLDGTGGAYELRFTSRPMRFRENLELYREIVKSFEETGSIDTSGDVEAGGDDGLSNWAQDPQGGAKTKKPTEDLSEEGLLKRVATTGGDRMLWAVQQWRDKRYERNPGAREKMFKALGGSFPHDARRLLLRSLQEHPLGTKEAMRCMQLEKTLPDALRKPILKQLGRAEAADADAVAAILADVPETGDLLVEEVLIRIGRPREGAAPRLLGARGVAWGRSDAGRELLGRLADDVAQLAPLMESEDPEQRALACDLLLGSKDAKGALKLLTSRLKDDAKEVRRRAAIVMGERRDARASMYLALALTREKSKSLLTVYKTTLEQLPQGETVGYLNKLYRKDNSRARLAAVMAARALKIPRVVPLLMTATKDAKKPVALAALRGLQSMCNHAELKRQMVPMARDLEDLVKASKDPEISRLASRVYFSLTGRVVRR